jgi:hypothetical protein
MDIDFESAFRMLYAIGVVVLFLFGLFFRAIPSRIIENTLCLQMFPLIAYALDSAQKDAYESFGQKFNTAIRTTVIGIAFMLASFGFGCLIHWLIQRGRHPNGRGITIDRSYALMRTASPKGNHIDRRV